MKEEETKLPSRPSILELACTITPSLVKQPAYSSCCSGESEILKKRSKKVTTDLGTRSPVGVSAMYWDWDGMVDKM